MARPRRSSSQSLPIVLSSVSVGLSAALLVGWIYVILRNVSLTRQYVANIWLLVAGVASIATIITVLVLFSVFLVREIREVRRQTSFIDSVTHELRSPLASLRLGLETLARPGLTDPARVQVREMMLEDVERLSAFVEDILQATRLSDPDFVRTRTAVVGAVGLRELIERTRTAVCRRHGVDLACVRVDVPDTIELATDPAALELIVKNLLDNAVKYSSPPPVVHVRARDLADGRVRLTVEDQGIGIPRQELRRVFERFYRVPLESVRERHGTGLGLFVVSALARTLGAKLSAHSEGPGTGTTMELLLPRERAVRGRGREPTVPAMARDA